MIKFTPHALLHSNGILSYSLLIQTWIKIVDIFIVSQIFCKSQVLYSCFILPKFVHMTISKHCFRFTIAQRQVIIWIKDEPVHCFHKASPDHDLTLHIYSFICMSGKYRYIDKDITQGHSCGILSLRHHALAPIGTKASAIPMLTSQWPWCLIMEHAYQATSFNSL